MTLGMINVQVVTCPGCGSSAIDATSTCTYCGNRLLIAQGDAIRFPEVVESRDQRLGRIVDHRLAQLGDEIDFLAQQFNETQHPSIPIKIANLKKKMAVLNKMKTKSN